VRTRGGRAVLPSSWVIVAFWIVAIVSTVVAFAIWLISRVISVETEVTEELRAKVVEVVNKRPVHRTLESSAVVVTSVDARSKASPRAVPEPSGPDGKIP
jgi:Na+-transporting methylmalonyl-CoA/oxaloacetate decarboxylase gamma subunit